MENKLNDILNELYSTNPELKNDQAALENVLQKLAAARPEAKLDPLFSSKLKTELIQKFSQTKKHNLIEPTMQKFNFRILAVGLAAILLIIVGWRFSGKQSGNIAELNNNGSQLFSGKPQIQKLADNKFDLSNLALANSSSGSGSGSNQQTNPQAQAVNPTPSPSASGSSIQSGAATQGTAGSPMIAAPLIPATGLGGGGGQSVIKGMPIRFQPYNFHYSGDPLNLADTKLDVLQRTTADISGGSALDNLKQLNLGAIDLGTFDNLRVQNFNLIQDQDYGYSINIDLENGTLNISQNYQKWPHPNCGPVPVPLGLSNGAAKSQALIARPCFYNGSGGISLSDIPSDSDLINIAAQFLKYHGIPVSNYGSAEVQNYWRAQYDSLSDQQKAQFYFPESITVLFPLQINGRGVFDQSGNAYGLSVNIDVKSKKVSGLYNLESQNYQSSSYDAETDSSRIIKIAEQGGLNNYAYIQDQSSDVKTLDLGTPTIGYMIMWGYSKQPGQQFYVPALIFPIQNKPTDLYQSNIVVPIVKEVLDQFDNNQNGNIPPVKPQNFSTPATQAPNSSRIQRKK